MERASGVLLPIFSLPSKYESDVFQKKPINLLTGLRRQGKVTGRFFR